MHGSGQMHPETIDVLSRRKLYVRAVDAAEHLGDTRPSVSRAMGLLRERGHITMDKEGWITLTDAGRAIAERIYERHCLLTQWLIQLGVSPEVAAEDACKLEHDLSDETFQCMKNHIKNASF